ncbi:MAG: hypothetical protein AABW46_02130 [Nanoarchaeota archaeon]
MRRGQAAMEFLMTYGWAILVVLIAIGALAYFGVLNPSRFLPSSCTLMPGLSCEAFKVDATAAGGHIRVDIQNGIGQDLTAVSITTVGDSGGACTGDASTAAVLNDGATVTHTITCAVVPTAGARFKSDLTIAYTDEGGIAHTRTGQIVAEVEAS